MENLLSDIEEAKRSLSKELRYRKLFVSLWVLGVLSLIGGVIVGSDHLTGSYLAALLFLWPALGGMVYFFNKRVDRAFSRVESLVRRQNILHIEMKYRKNVDAIIDEMKKY
tara:strand:- start:1622 stop:1954 length:333 start_codon:yes stop_codon:yes gene_type:complete